MSDNKDDWFDSAMKATDNHVKQILEGAVMTPPIDDDTLDEWEQGAKRAQAREMIEYVPTVSMQPRALLALITEVRRLRRIVDESTLMIQIMADADKGTGVIVGHAGEDLDPGDTVVIGDDGIIRKAK